MNISYEEAMRRIDEYEKADLNKYIEGLKAYGFDYERTLYEIEKYEKKLRYRCCRETSFPYDIHLYRGEGQILVVPLTKCMFWRRRELSLYCSLSDSENAINIGKTIKEVFDYLKNCPVDTRNVEECRDDDYVLNNTICKNYKVFIKKYSLCFAVLNEDGTYIISASERDNKGYGGLDDPNDSFRFKLPKEASEEEIGNVVVAALNRSDEFERAKKPDPYPPVEVELLSDQKIEIFPPRDRHFTDMEDGGATEIYRLYEYYPKEGAESSAEFYLGIAAELDCDMSEENIRRVWEEMYGSAEMFTIGESTYETFTLRVEMRNKAVHRISYLKQIDENELLECTMEVKQPNRRKKLDEQLSEMFETFAGKCAML